MKDRKVKSVSYNGRQCGNINDGLDFDADYAAIGKEDDGSKRIPVKMKERFFHKNHWVDIHYEDGTSKRVFNVCEIEYFAKEE